MTSVVIYQPSVPPHLQANASPFDIFQTETSEYCAQFVLQQPAHRFNDDERDSNGYSLIHRVCLRGDALVLAALLQIGCNPSALTSAGMTGVHLAAMRGHVVLLHMLFQAGASLEQADPRGRTALHHAAANNQVIAVAWLLQVTQVDWTTTVDHSGNTPLHLACAAGRRETVRLFLDASRSGLYRGKWDPMTRDQAGNTCLHAAFTTIPPPSTYGISSTEAVANRALNVIWPLLSTPPTDSNFALQVIHARNHKNETPIDLAVKAHAGLSLYSLLFFARVFSSHFRPRNAYTLFIWTYRLVWLAHLLLPGFIIFIAFCFAHWSHNNWLNAVGAGLAAASSLRQRHRLKDGTDRPNPYFLGALITGIVVTVYVSIYDIAASQLTTGHTHYIILSFHIFLAAMSTLLWYRLVFWRHPSLSADSAVNRTLTAVVSTEADGIRQRLLLLLPAADTDHPMRTSFDFNDMYCVKCDLFLLGKLPSQIKHCRLCDRCRLAMDHHCLFVMNCITQANLRQFVLFLLCTLGFMATYCLLAILHCVQFCQMMVPVEALQSDYHYAWPVCLFKWLLRPVLLIPFHLVAGLWLCMLLSEQGSRLIRSGLIQQQRSLWGKQGRGLSCGFRQYVRVMLFVLFGERGCSWSAQHPVPDL